MKWFTDLSTKAKLFYGFSAMWILLAIVIAAAYLGIARMTTSEIELRDHYIAEALQLRQLQANQNYNRGRILEMILTDDRSELQTMAMDIKELGRQNDGLIENLAMLEQAP